MWPCTRKYVFHMKLKFSIYAPRIRFFLSDDVNLCKWITHQGCFENWNMSWSTRWFKRESYLYNFIPFVQPPFRTWPNFVSKMHWDIGNLSKTILTYPHLFYSKLCVCTFYVHLCTYECKFLLMYILLVWIKLSIRIEQQGFKKV